MSKFSVAIFLILNKIFLQFCLALKYSAVCLQSSYVPFDLLANQALDLGSVSEKIEMVKKYKTRLSTKTQSAFTVLY